MTSRLYRNRQKRDQQTVIAIAMIFYIHQLENETPLRLRDFLPPQLRSLCNGNVVPRCGLVDPHLSPWVKLLHSNSQKAMIAFTGFDYATFFYLVRKIRPIYNTHTPRGEDGAFRRLQKTCYHTKNDGRSYCSSFCTLFP